MIVEPCPGCHAVGSLDVKKAALVGQASTATCGHCGWSGELADVAVAAVHGELEGIEELAMDIATTVREGLKGPLVECLIRRGLLRPPIDVRNDYAEEPAMTPARISRFNVALLSTYDSIIRELLPHVVEISIRRCGEEAARLRDLDPREQPREEA